MKLPRLLLLLCISSVSVFFILPPGKAKTATAAALHSVYGRHATDTIIIPFEYKQSALYHAFTFEVIDSIATILLKNDSITLSIDGYAHFDEGSDTICYYLSLNRALFVRDYVLGRGISASRIKSVKGLGRTRPLTHGTNKNGKTINCRAELILNYPLPPPPKEIIDTDEDGIADEDDKCPAEYGYAEYNGCPNKDAMVIFFENDQSSISSGGYYVLDTIAALLKANPSFTIAVEAHAGRQDKAQSVCNQLAKDRAEIVKQYLASRYIAVTRIDTVKTFCDPPIKPSGKNPLNRNSRVEVVLNRHL